MKCVTIHHLRDIASGAKLNLKCDKIKVYIVPYYESLSVERMLEFASQYEEVSRYLPALKREINKLPR